MALKDLQNDLEALGKFIFEGKGEGNKAYRRLWARPSHLFTIDENLTYTELMGHAEGGGSGYENKIRIFQNHPPEVQRQIEKDMKEFCADLLKYYRVNIPLHADAKRGAIVPVLPAPTHQYTFLVNSKDTTAAGLAGEAHISDPFKWLQDIRTLYGNTVINTKEKYKKLFNLSTSFREGFSGKRAGQGAFDPDNLAKGGFSMLGNIGHMEGDTVSEVGSRQAAGFIDSIDTAVIDGKDDRLAIAKAQFFETNATLKLWLDTDGLLNVDPKNPTIDMGTIVKTNLEGSFLNQMRGATSEKDAKQKVKEAFNAFQEEVRRYYEEVVGIEGYTNRAGSRSFIDNYASLMVFASPSTKKLLKKKRAKTSVKKPEPIKPKKTTPITREVPIKKTATHGKVGGVGGVAKGKGRRDGSTQPQQGNLASLIELLQAKLPDTVAKNMGPPALTNQTGRFASSVRITDVNQTAKGYPSVGYTYQKNPYQVFEVGHGDLRWATPSRDPRKLIDASIREIAAQHAIGRFYTRRV